MCPYSRNSSKNGDHRVFVSEEGKACKSIFTPERSFKEAALVRVKLITGRTHQIRVHAAHLGQPVAGDEKYGDKAFNRLCEEKGLDRMFLHAAVLGFTHPDTGEFMVLEAPLPEKLGDFLEIGLFH